MPQGRWLHADHDVPRMHVGVEKAIAKHLCEKDSYPILRQLGQVDTGLSQALNLADGHTIHSLHDHHIRMAQVPVNAGYLHQANILHVASQLRGVGSLPHEVKLIMQVLVELRDDLFGLETLTIRRQALHPCGNRG